MTNEQKDAFLNWLGNVEGFRSRVYKCPAGIPTIGYGHALLTSREYAKYCDKPLTLTEAKSLLKQDFHRVCCEVSQGDFVLAENELYAVAELAFNIGVTKLRKSGLWHLLIMYSNAIDKRSFSFADLLKKRIGEKFLDFRFYHDKNGVKRESDGLKARRNMDKELFLGTSYILK